MANQMQIANVHGYRIRYDPTAIHGINYLKYDLSAAEALVFIKQAKMYGNAQFEDDKDRDYTLVRGADGTFTLVLRKESSSWF